MSHVPIFDEEHGVDAYFRHLEEAEMVIEASDEADLEYEELLADAELLEKDDDPMSCLELPDQEEEFTRAKVSGGVKPKATDKKFNLRVKAKSNPAGKRGRPTKAAALAKAVAKAKAEGRHFIPPTAPAKPPAKPPSAASKAKKKAKASQAGKDHRERRNAAVDGLRKVLPGATPKLDTANTLELGVDFILFTRKRTDIDIEAINQEFLAFLKVNN